jgi:membrane fusion protein (multidrug efflux system)
MRLLKALVVVVVSVTVVLVAHHFLQRSEPRQRTGGGGEIAVVAEPVVARDFADRTEAIGTVSANESVIVTPAVTERVAAVHFENGAFVEPGDVLVELEHAEESAELEEARIDLAEQERQFDRVSTLRARDLVSQEELDLAQGYLDSAKARVEAAEARLRDRIITAPFAGVLGIRRVSPGSLLAQVAVGQSIEGRTSPWPDDTFTGRVTSVDSRVDPTTRAIAVQALVPNPEGKLRAGMLMTIELTCCLREALGVPERALLSYADKQYVYVVRGDQTVQQREVRLGSRDVGWVEVLDGLSPGDTIVVDGLLSLRDGARVRLEPVPGSGAGTGASPPSSE